MYLHLFANSFLFIHHPVHAQSSTRPHKNRLPSVLIYFPLFLKKFMDAVSSEHRCASDMATAKRLLEGEGTALPEPKRAKIDENPDKGSHISGLSGTSEATHKSKKGKQNEKNKGRRRGTRPQVEDHADRPKTPRLPKKQCAILIGFLGTSYAGMQM